MSCSGFRSSMPLKPHLCWGGTCCHSPVSYCLWQHLLSVSSTSPNLHLTGRQHRIRSSVLSASLSAFLFLYIWTNWIFFLPVRSDFVLGRKNSGAQVSKQQCEYVHIFFKYLSFLGFLLNDVDALRSYITHR